MTVETTPNPETQADEVHAQTGSEEEAIAAFDARRKGSAVEEPEEETKEEAEPDHEPEAESDEEPGDGETEADDEPKEELVEVEFEGKTYEVAPELQKGLMRQADYSRKMNEVGEKAKVYTQRMEQAEKLVEGAEKYAEVLSEVHSIDADLKRFEKVDWQGLRQQNPAEFAALAAEMQMLRLSRDEATRKANGLDEQLARARHEAILEKRNEMHSVLRKDLKGWGDELSRKVCIYALKNGYQPVELEKLTDARTVIALDKARRYDALQEAKTTLKSKAQDAPQVTKPGAKRPPANVAGEAMARLRKSNSPDDAVAAFEARAKSR